MGVKGKLKKKGDYWEVKKKDLPYPIVDALVETGLCKSKSEARRIIKSGGIYLNDRKITVNL